MLEAGSRQWGEARNRLLVIQSVLQELKHRLHRFLFPLRQLGVVADSLIHRILCRELCVNVRLSMRYEPVTLTDKAYATGSFDFFIRLDSLFAPRSLDSIRREASPPCAQPREVQFRISRI